MRRERFGGLDTIVSGDGAGPVVVLLHGFGAPGDDLVPLAQILDVPDGTRFVFPAAPHLLPGYAGGRAWWNIDLDDLERDRSHEVPPELPDARAKVVALLDEVAAKLLPTRVVLGGFSQGAMLACDVALQVDRDLAGLVMLSGTLIAEQEWTPRLPSRRGLPVFQSHGTQDPLLPYEASERLHELLAHGGLAVEWVPFRGGHEIPPPVMDRLTTFLRQVLG